MLEFNEFKKEVNVLKELGFSETEAKVYILLLNSHLSVWDISKQLKMHRSSVYEAIEKLASNGLVSKIKENNRELLKAHGPERILEEIQRKEHAIEETIPKLKSIKIKQSYHDAEIIEGVKSFINTLTEFLPYKEDILVYGIPKSVPAILKDRIMRFHHKRIKQHVNMFHIYNHNAKERINFLNTLPFTEARVLNFDANATTNICGDIVTLTVWDSQVWTIIIRNKEIADSYKRYFKFLWKSAVKPQN